MTIKKLSKIFYCVNLLALAIAAPSMAAERVGSFDEALEKAGPDGVIAYCYGPDWNMRSTRMLRSFWNTPELMEAAGDAMLVAVPFYQDPYTKGAETGPEIQGSMPAPKSGICPAVLMFDKEGRLYASLLGGDGLFQNKEEEVAEFIKSKKKKKEEQKPLTNEELEEGKLGLANIKKNLAYLKEQEELLKKAEAATTPKDKTMYISQAAELPITPPENYINNMIDIAPLDEGSYIKRSEFSALAFMYEQLDTTDGFIPDDFYEDPEVIAKACKAVYEDKSLKAADRQAAYALMIGAQRRASERGSILKRGIKSMGDIDLTTCFGLMSADLMEFWGTNKSLSSDERKALRDKKKAQDKAKKEKEAREKKAANDFTIE